MGNLIDVQVPDLGDFRDVPVIELLVKDGDTVEKDQALLVLESDKSTMEVPSPGSGIVRGLKVQVGDKLSKGDRICRLEGEGAAPAPKSAPAAKPAAESPAPAKKESEPASADLFPDSGAPAKTAATTGDGATLTVTVPDLGDFHDVPIIELLVKDGDTVEKDQALLVLESDKSTMEVPAPEAGVVRGLKVKLGDKVSKGHALMTLEGATGSGGGAAPAAAATTAPQKKAEPSADKLVEELAPAAVKPPDDVVAPSGGSAHAGPATRKFARELGVDLSKVPGSGAKGRVLIEDVQKYVKQQMTAAPGPGSRVPALVPASRRSPCRIFRPTARSRTNRSHASARSRRRT